MLKLKSVVEFNYSGKRRTGVVEKTEFSRNGRTVTMRMLIDGEEFSTGYKTFTISKMVDVFELTSPE